jgi:oligopeptide transport system ATP-binding protein
MNKILQIKNLKIYFELQHNMFTPRKIVHAVDNISFDVYSGETLGIVGESGCGKSSLARSLVGLNPITSGSVIFNNQYDLTKLGSSQWQIVRKSIQFIFQDPIAALDPRMTVLEIIAEPLSVLQPNLSNLEVVQKVLTTMKLVGLNENQLNRYPSEFSGGQCQRIGIARALVLEPQILICDESVSALDVSIKAQIINLLQDLQHKLQLTIIFISHDLSIVRHICNRVLVMYLGNIMEVGDKQSVFTSPMHPYTDALLSAIPVARPEYKLYENLKLLEGDLPSPINPPPGCVFNTRCPKAEGVCFESRPPLENKHNITHAACFKV